MAFDMFLSVSGIQGESMYKGRAGDVDVLAWSWETRSGERRISVQDLNVTTYIDSAAPLLLAIHERLEPVDVVLTIRSPSLPEVPFIQKMTLGGARVSSISMGGSGADDRLVQNIAFSFESIKMEFQPLSRRGEPLDIVEYGFMVPPSLKGSER